MRVPGSFARMWENAAYPFNVKLGHQGQHPFSKELLCKVVTTLNPLLAFWIRPYFMRVKWYICNGLQTSSEFWFPECINDLSSYGPWSAKMMASTLVLLHLQGSLTIQRLVFFWWGVSLEKVFVLGGRSTFQKLCLNEDFAVLQPKQMAWNQKGDLRSLTAMRRRHLCCFWRLTLLWRRSHF